MNLVSRNIFVLILSLATAGAAFAGDETLFPKRSRVLTAKAPPECKQWIAPVPDRQVPAQFPKDVGASKGDVALLVRINANGTYNGLIDYSSNEEAFVRAAEASVKEWTFKPALCNGVAIASDARLDFQFRKEGGIIYR